jgi:parallel beta-helix repeat protein
MKNRIALFLSVLVLSAIFVMFCSTAAKAQVRVDCTTESLQTALNSAAVGATIDVTGTCNENITIHKNGQILDGGGNATISGTTTTDATAKIVAFGVIIRGFTITGGLDAVQLRSGNATLDSNVIGGNTTARYGVVASTSSTVIMLNNKVENLPGDGVAIFENSSARIGIANSTDTTANPNIIQNNGGYGISVARSSSARIVGNTITGNAGGGIGVSRVSNADVTANSISGNQAAGIVVMENSGLNLGTTSGTDIFSLANSTDPANKNVGVGIMCSVGAYAQGSKGTLTGTKGVFKSATGCTNGTTR